MSDNNHENERRENPLPEPEEKASALEQRVTPTALDQTLELARKVPGLPATNLDSALNDFIVSGTRRLTVSDMLRFVASWAKELGMRFAEGTQVISALKSSQQELYEQSAKQREEIATLKEQIRIENRYKPLKNFIYIVSPILVAMGLDQLRENHLGIGSCLIAIGCALIGLSIWGGRAGENK